ncbi:hypothetical protein D3C80_1661100 [compost metagenome]
MPGLLAAKVITAATHFLHHIAISYGCLSRFQADALRSLEEANIRHYCRYNRVMLQLAVPLHGVTNYAQNEVAIHLFAILIDSDQAIRIPVER